MTLTREANLVKCSKGPPFLPDLRMPRYAKLYDSWSQAMNLSVRAPENDKQRQRQNPPNTRLRVRVSLRPVRNNGKTVNARSTVHEPPKSSGLSYRNLSLAGPIRWSSPPMETLSGFHRTGRVVETAVALGRAAQRPGLLGGHVTEDLLIERREIRTDRQVAITELLGAMVHTCADDNRVEPLFPIGRVGALPADGNGLITHVKIIQIRDVRKE